MFNWNKTLHIVRGLPGEGKSTLALSLVGGNRQRVVENDDFWYMPKPRMGYSEELIVAHGTSFHSNGIDALFDETGGVEEQGPYLHHKIHGFEYKYDATIAALAANWCGAEAFRRLRIFDTVAVANVFARRDHVFGYLAEAKKMQVRVLIHRPTTAWVGNVEECSKRNIHAAPQVAIQKFSDTWENITQEEVDILINLPSELRQSGTARNL